MPGVVLEPRQGRAGSDPRPPDPRSYCDPASQSVDLPAHYREDSNTMTTPTFDTQQLDVPETAVADSDAALRERRKRRIDTARFWVAAALTAGISALVA